MRGTSFQRKKLDESMAISLDKCDRKHGGCHCVTIRKIVEFESPRGSMHIDNVNICARFRYIVERTGKCQCETYRAPDRRVHNEISQPAPLMILVLFAKVVKFHET